MRGGLLGFGGFGGGGQGGGVWVRRGGGALLGRGCGGWGGFNPQLDSRISSLAQPSHPNSPRLAQHGVFAAQVSVRRRDCSHSRNPDRIEHPHCGLRSSIWYRAHGAWLNSAVRDLSMTCDSVVHKMCS